MSIKVDVYINSPLHPSLVSHVIHNYLIWPFLTFVDFGGSSTATNEQQMEPFRGDYNGIN